MTSDPVDDFQGKIHLFFLGALATLAGAWWFAGLDVTAAEQTIGYGLQVLGAVLIAFVALCTIQLARFIDEVVDE